MTHSEKLLLKQDLVFIDTETTGFKPGLDRVIEIGFIRVRNGEIIDEYETLVNPKIPLPESSTIVTGITQEDLDPAPTFAEVQAEVFEKMSRSIFIAHNVDFDYNFMSSEFMLHEKPLILPRLCTVKLTRYFYPQFINHKLDTISKMFEIKIENRHRALDDARALFEVYKIIHEEFPTHEVESGIAELIKMPESKASKNLAPKKQMGLL